MFNTLKEIGQKFRLPGEIYSYGAITMGNINSTYKVIYTQNDNSLKSYLFQRVNTLYSLERCGAAKILSRGVDEDEL